MRKDIDSISVIDLIKYWKDCLEQYVFLFKPEEQFQEIEIKSQGSPTDIGEAIDWWPKYQVNRRIEILNEWGAVGPGYHWKTHQGTLDTADFLWKSKDSLDKWAAIFIQGFIKDLRDNFPDSWTSCRGITHDILAIFAKEDNYFFKWHYATRHALPVKITDNWKIEEAINPKDIRTFIEISALSAIITLSSYQLVRVIGVD